MHEGLHPGTSRVRVAGGPRVVMGFDSHAWWLRRQRPVGVVLRGSRAISPVFKVAKTERVAT